MDGRDVQLKGKPRKHWIGGTAWLEDSAGGRHGCSESPGPAHFPCTSPAQSQFREVSRVKELSSMSVFACH